MREQQFLNSKSEPSMTYIHFPIWKQKFGSYKSAPIAATFWLVHRQIRRVAAAAAIVYCGGTCRNRLIHLDSSIAACSIAATSGSGSAAAAVEKGRSRKASAAAAIEDLFFCGMCSIAACVLLRRVFYPQCIVNISNFTIYTSRHNSRPGPQLEQYFTVPQKFSLSTITNDDSK